MNTSIVRHPGLRWIAAFKLVKALALVLVGVGVLTLVHRDVAGLLWHGVAALHVDPDNHFLHGIIAKAGLMNDRQLEQLSLGTFVYAAVLVTEGAGLWFGKTWAEYLTVVATSSLIPLEFYELSRHPTLVRLLVLGINLVVVGYLVAVLRRERRSAPPTAASDA